MILNTSTNQILSPRELQCKTLISQSLGLMFRKKQNAIFLFPKEKKISLHMFFVFYPIDVILLDEKKRVIEIIKNLQPFTFWKSKEKGKYLVELEQSKGLEVKIGDLLEFKI